MSVRLCRFALLPKTRVIVIEFIEQYEWFGLSSTVHS